MRVSTKVGTVVELVSRGQRAAAQARTSPESLERGSFRGLVGLPVWDGALNGPLHPWILPSFFQGYPPDRRSDRAG